MTQTTVDYVRGAAKAGLAGAVSFVSTVAVAAQDSVVTTGEWWTAAAAGLAAVAVVYGVPNTGPKAPAGTLR